MKVHASTDLLLPVVMLLLLCATSWDAQANEKLNACVLVMDISSSVGDLDDEGTQRNEIATLLQATMPEEVSLGGVAFGKIAGEIWPLDTVRFDNAEDYRDAFAAAVAERKGGTEIGVGLQTALEMLGSRQRACIVLVSDGQIYANTTAPTPGGRNRDHRAANARLWANIIPECVSRGIPVHCVFLPYTSPEIERDGLPGGEIQMENIASRTGGIFTRIDPDRAEDLFLWFFDNYTPITGEILEAEQPQTHMLLSRAIVMLPNENAPLTFGSKTYTPHGPSDGIVMALPLPSWGESGFALYSLRSEEPQIMDTGTLKPAYVGVPQVASFGELILAGQVVPYQGTIPAPPQALALNREALHFRATRTLRSLAKGTPLIQEFSGRAVYTPNGGGITILDTLPAVEGELEVSATLFDSPPGRDATPIGGEVIIKRAHVRGLPIEDLEVHPPRGKDHGARLYVTVGRQVPADFGRMSVWVYEGRPGRGSAETHTAHLDRSGMREAAFSLNANMNGRKVNCEIQLEALRQGTPVTLVYTTELEIPSPPVSLSDILRWIAFALFGAVVIIVGLLVARYQWKTGRWHRKYPIRITYLNRGEYIAETVPKYPSLLRRIWRYWFPFKEWEFTLLASNNAPEAEVVIQYNAKSGGVVATVGYGPGQDLATRNETRTPVRERLAQGGDHQFMIEFPKGGLTLLKMPSGRGA